MAMAGRKVAVQMAAARAMAGVGPLPTKIRQGEAELDTGEKEKTPPWGTVHRAAFAVSVPRRFGRIRAFVRIRAAGAAVRQKTRFREDSGPLTIA